jgi:hypothetical protein
MSVLRQAKSIGLAVIFSNATNAWTVGTGAGIIDADGDPHGCKSFKVACTKMISNK